MLVFILILLVNFTSAKELPPGCIENFRKNDASFCAYPLPHLTEENNNECAKRCEDETDLDVKDCCRRKCNLGIKLGLSTDGHLKCDSYEKAFDYKELDINRNTSDAEATWSPVVEKSFETCRNKGRKTIS